MPSPIDFYETRKELGLSLVKPTGEVHPDNPYFIQYAETNGEYKYARPCFNGLISVPTIKKLLKRKVFMWIAFEKGSPGSPVYMGFMPYDSDVAPENFPDVSLFETGTFDLIVDDANNSWRLEQGNSKIESTQTEITFDNNRLNLGANADEPVIKGNDAVKLFDDYFQLIEQISFASPFGPIQAPLNTASLIAKRQQLRSILSTKIFTE
jgi:hypothetical protein